MELFFRGKPVCSEICKLPLFRDFSSDDLLRLSGLLSFGEDNFSRGQLIFRCGQKLNRLAVISHGKACADFHSLPGEGENNMGLFGEGAVVGLETIFSTPRTSPSDIIAVSDSCRVLTFDPYPLLNGNCSDPDANRFIRNCLNQLSDRYVRNLYWIKVLNQRSLRDKILTFIYIMTKRHQKNHFEMKMTQDEFASYLRVARGSLNRELQLLKKEGYLVVEGRRYSLLKPPENYYNTCPPGAKSNET